MSQLETRRCELTGLQLVAAQSSPRYGYRIAKKDYGPLNPRRQPAALSEVDRGWGRFDTLGGSTVYLGGTLEVAFTEVLSYFRRELGDATNPADSLAKDAAAVGMSLEAFVAEVDREWRERQHMPLKQLAAIWRHERRSYRLTMPTTGWWIDLHHPHSLQALEESIPDTLRAHGFNGATLGTLHSDIRALTVSIATWARIQTLDDGSRAHGIRYPSNHGAGTSYAYWLRRVDDGGDTQDEAVRSDNGTLIEPTTVAFKNACERFGRSPH